MPLVPKTLTFVWNEDETKLLYVDIVATTAKGEGLKRPNTFWGSIPTPEANALLRTLTEWLSERYYFHKDNDNG